LTALKKFEVIGSYTVYQFHSIIIEAPSAEEAKAIAIERLEEEFFEYLEWDEKGYNSMDDFEIGEVIEIAAKPALPPPSSESA
jgi:hypothetical protein